MLTRRTALKRYQSKRKPTRHRFLVVHGVTASAWIDRYGLEPFSHPCDCGTVLTTTIPFACGQLRGLKAPPCACGNVNTPYCVVRDPKFGDLFSGGAL